MKTVLRTAITLCLVIGSASAQAAEQNFDFDTSHSTVMFRVSHLGMSHVFGRFQSVSGSVSMDPENIAGAAIKASIDASSVDTNFEKRDQHLKSPDFFNAGEFGTIEFKSTGLDLADGKAGTMTGDLTLLGVTKPITLNVTVNHSGPHPSPQAKGAAAVGVSANGKITRSEFGMNGFLPGLGDEVELWIEVEAIAK